MDILQKVASARTAAFETMRDVYVNADLVLILDAGLHELSIGELGGLEVASRVYCSSWGQRLWTLHEGGLAWRTYVQFQDCARVLSGKAGLRRELDSWLHTGDMSTRLIARRMKSRHQILRGLQQEGVTSLTRCIYSTWRSTTA